MCGIAGGFWRTDTPLIERRLTAALDLMRHRGPDDNGHETTRTDAGTVAIGQNRLSIIDLSERGHQPMLSEDGSLVIVFNGEVYNYRELREELRALGHRFRSDSDTEVLLTAWAQWGKSCLTRIEGMFAFAVHDRRAQTLTCVRDAFGIKPFFYSIEGDSFVFASELPALVELRGTVPLPDLQRAYDYLVNGEYDGRPQSFIAGARHLLPGMLLEIDLRTNRIGEPELWWRAPVPKAVDLSFNDAVEAVRERFLHNIRLHLRSDVPLGAALSGGVDSSAVVCAIRHVEPKASLHTFSYIAEGNELSEEKWVDLINEVTGAVPHKVRASAQDLARDIDAVVTAQGEPFGSTSIYAQYRVFKLAKENGIKVTLDGQGADELLAGYSGYPGQRLLSLMENGQYTSMHRFVKNWADWPGRSYKEAWMLLGRATFPDAVYLRARKALGRDAQPAWLKTDVLRDAGVVFRENRISLDPANKGRRVIEQLAHALQQRGLPHLLRHGDRNAMAFSIESRVPFLTIPMAELLLSLPENYLISDTGETKHVFRAAMRGIVPDAVLDRRDKIGFATPEKSWFLSIAPLIRTWLEDADNVPFIDRAAMLAAFDRVIGGKVPFNWQVWRWVNYVRWYSMRIGGRAGHA
ncbi:MULTISPECIES: asparagine synthase (glutamine-hydrolyzing) [Mesorhizobium]|uniref:asparagine synthase (glutamine-hydrolyzing) n=1 Tax=Mesorhizobium denitrificans TaxID=2294114 RepID=A0A371XBY8_9HYPH|nr:MULTISPECIES: asparagine synthase (glutamine-hydrolyzing) [Mesorhizobium]RFC66757.1 asparagine synthase (glutamine-hydrolyzing) [Mesorhizobium denitrificans]